MATRTGVGLFDVYYQVAVEVAGADAENLLQYLCVNDIARLVPGKSLYTSLCNEQGGMVDDLTVFRMDADRFWLCPTPSRVLIITDWITDHGRARCAAATVTNLGYKNAYMSIQGPKSRALLQKLTDADIGAEAVKYFTFTTGTVAQVAGVVISRTGYSGELGFELFYSSEYAEHMWDSVMQAGEEFGILPCGLGTLRTLRIEKKYPLYGLDIDDTTSPIEAGLGWTVKPDAGDFIGRAALMKQIESGPDRMLVCIKTDSETEIAIGDDVMKGNVSVGTVRSSEIAHSLSCRLSMAYVPASEATDRANFTIAGTTGTVTLAPPYDPARERMKL